MVSNKGILRLKDRYDYSSSEENYFFLNGKKTDLYVEDAELYADVSGQIDKFLGEINGEEIDLIGYGKERVDKSLGIGAFTAIDGAKITQEIDLSTHSTKYSDEINTHSWEPNLMNSPNPRIWKLQKPFANKQKNINMIYFEINKKKQIYIW